MFIDVKYAFSLLREGWIWISYQSSKIENIFNPRNND